MPVPHVDVQNGSVANGPLTKGCNFKWSNPSSNQANLSGCSGFCTTSSFTVYANSTTDAQILANPTDYNFPDSAWNAPRVPRILVNPDPNPMEVHRQHKQTA